MRARLAAIVLVALLAPAGAADDDEWKGDPDLGTMILNAVAFDGQLWLSGEGQLRSLGGALVSYRLDDGTRAVHIARNVVGIAKLDGRLLALVAENRRHYLLLQWKKGAFVTVSRADLPEPAQLMAVIGGKIAAVTHHKVITFDGNQWRTIASGFASPKPMHAPPTAAGATASGGSIYLGYNYGEWGGGLLRIDAQSGETKPVKLDVRFADNVTAIMPDPSKANCVIISLGLIHFESVGEIDRVCGDTATRVFVNPPDKAGDFGSEAFYALVPAGSGYWAVGSQALYHFAGAGDPVRQPIEGFEPWHGLYISRKQPGIILVLSEISRHNAVNGGMPLVAPLD